MLALLCAQERGTHSLFPLRADVYRQFLFVHVPTCYLSLFPMSVDDTDAGGELEAQSACDEALHAVFSLHLTRRHLQCHRSRKDGKTKWSMIEMWPMHVSQ